MTKVRFAARNQPRIANFSAQRGFSMIEVLVTVLIITLALFGTAALQAYSLRINQVGKFRGLAVLLVDDLAERMEANFAFAEQYDLAITGSAPASGVDCSATLCDGATLATHDLARWQNAVAKSLPQSTWAVASAPLSAGSPLISTTFTLFWQERATNATNTTSTATITASYIATRMIKTTP